MWEYFINIVDKIADFPFGIGKVWAFVAGKPLSRAQAFDIHIHFSLIVLYAVGLLALTLSGTDVSSFAPQGFLLIVFFGILSFLTSIIFEHTERQDRNNEREN